VLLEVGNPVFGVEIHGLFEVAHARFIVGYATKDKGSIARLTAYS
jgi:hypothetical protein